MANFFDQFDATPSSQFGGAIANIESGGNYRAVGPQTGKGRALGKYQVMDFNVGPWTKEALGQEMTPMQFLGSPDAQEAVFNHKFGQYAQKYGPEGAARAWFAGEGGMNNQNARDVLGTTVKDYATKFVKGMGSAPANAMSFAPQEQQAGNFFDQFDAAAAPVDNGASFDERFNAAQPVDNKSLKSGLKRTAQAMTRGPAVSPGQTMLADVGNILPAASQGTTPNISAQSGNLVSDQVFENDAGMTMFRDPSTGKMVEADSAQHVVLRDPADNRLKVFARSSDTNEGAAVGVARVLAPGLAVGAPTARAAIPVANAVKRPAPTAQMLKDEAKQGFEAFRNSGVEIPAPQMKELSRSIASELNADGFFDVLAPKTFGVLSKLGSGPDDAVVTAGQLHAFRRALGKVAGSLDDTEKAAASTVMSKFDEFLGTIPGTEETLRPALGNYAAAKRSEQVGGALEKAKMQAESTGSGANIDNAMRQQMKSLVNNPKKTRGWNAEEIDAAKGVVRGDLLTNAARYGGKMAPTGVVSGSLSGVIGFVLGGGAGAVGLPIVGYASKVLADTMTVSKVRQLDELIRSRSPLAKQMEASLSAWQGKVNDLAKSPNAPKVAQVVIATRNLVNNLKDAGVVISPAEFIKALQGPMRGRADNEQPESERVLDQ